MICVHVLGAGGATFTASRGPAAYWVEVDGHGLLLDPGPGALVRLVRQPGAPETVDAVPAVLFSHLHLDHTADLGPLLFALHSVLARCEEPLLLAGPPGLAAFLEGLRALYGDWLTPRLREVEVHEMDAGQSLALPGGGRAEAFAVEHAERRFSRLCLGWSFTDAAGRRLVYSGDTGPCPGLTEAARGCDLLLVECSTPDDLAVPEHMSPGGVTELVRASGCRQVVLTHLYPLVAAQRPDAAIAAATGVPCTAACDGDVFTLGSDRES